MGGVTGTPGDPVSGKLRGFGNPQGVPSLNNKASGCGRLEAAFDPTGRIQVGPGTKSGRRKKAAPGNETTGPVRRPPNVSRNRKNG